MKLFYRRPRRWLLHLRDLKHWRRPSQTICLIAVLCCIIFYSEIWHIPVIFGLGLAFLSLLSTVPHEKERNRAILIWNDELENRQRTLWGKLWHVADVLGRVQRLMGETLLFLEKLENSLTWEDQYVSIVALLLVGVVTSTLGALLQLFCTLYNTLPVRMICIALVTLYFLPMTTLKRRSTRLRQTTSSYLKSSFKNKIATTKTMILDVDDEDDDDEDDDQTRVVRYSTKLFTKGHSLPIWKRRRFKLYKERLSYWDVNAHADDFPKYSMRLADVTNLKSLKPEANMSRFEIESRISKDQAVSWIIGSTDERICSLWMSSIRTQKQRLELRAQMKRDDEIVKSKSLSRRNSNSSTPVHFLKTMLKLGMKMLFRWWERIPHHDEIIHRSIARSQLQSSLPAGRVRSASADSGSDEDD